MSGSNSSPLSDVCEQSRGPQPLDIMLARLFVTLRIQPLNLQSKQESFCNKVYQEMSEPISYLGGPYRSHWPHNPNAVFAPWVKIKGLS
jgi:hypothetical protein